MKHKWLGAVLAAIPAIGLMVAPAAADDYPVSTVKLITHSSPGGGTDVFLRQLAKHLSPIMGTTFVVENVRGGGGAKAMATLANGPKDGSAFYGTTPSYVITSLLSKPEATYEDLDSVVNMFYDPQVVFVAKDSPYQSLTDLVNDAKARPNALVVAVSTPSSLDRQVMEKLKTVTGTEMNILTHDGGGDVMLSVLNGTAQAGIGEIAELRGQLDAGALRLITTYTDERLSQFPDVKTAKEQGIDLVVRKFRGIAGPKGLPDNVIAAWEEGISKLLEDPEFKAWYEAEGVQKAYLNHEDASALTKEFADEMKVFFKEYNIVE
jgi:putative tricarboxylic transport membrane protein